MLMRKGQYSETLNPSSNTAVNTEPHVRLAYPNSHGMLLGSVALSCLAKSEDEDLYLLRTLLGLGF